jgi:hypothetical protein
MFGKMCMLFWQFLIVVVILFAPGNVMAEEVGKTPEGNVIYRFRCPGSIYIDGKLTLNWPNHISDHPEFDIDGSGSTWRSLDVRSTHAEIRRSGQEVRCNYRDFKMSDRPLGLGTLSYKYKVHRDIISCKSLTYMTLECILKP